MYENQKSDEVPTMEGAISLMNAKFFDQKKYDLTKAGRHKLGKKLNVIDRMEGETLHHDILKADGTVLLKKGTFIGREERNLMREELSKGSHIEVFPFNYNFSHPTSALVNTSDSCALVGRILAHDVDLKAYTLEEGTVLTAKDVKALAKEVETVAVYGGIAAQEVELTSANISSVLDYGQRFFVLGRLTDENGNDLYNSENELLINRYLVDQDYYLLSD